MKIVKTILKWILYIISIPLAYIIISLVLSFITVDRKVNNQIFDKLIYLNTNGVHLDVVMPLENVDSSLLSGLKFNQNEKYLSFGWGDENFYINTPTWGDLTFNNAIKAMFLKSPTLMHVTRYRSKRSDWIEIKISESELDQLNQYLQNTFKINEDGMKIILENEGYTLSDDFYKANGNYHCFNTYNSWVNKGFKESGLKSCLWTPFDFGLMHKYE